MSSAAAAAAADDDDDDADASGWAKVDPGSSCGLPLCASVA